MNKCVLDASAVLAYLNDEPGAAEIERWLDSASCLLSAANYAEVLSKLADYGMPLAEASKAVAILDLKIEAVDADIARRIAALRAPTRDAGLSLADRACLALAGRETCAAITADRLWLTVAEALQLDIRCIRPDAH